MIKDDINSLVKIHLESELLARGTDAAVSGTKKIAKGVLGFSIAAPVGLVGAGKVAEMTGRKLSQV